MLEPNAEIFPCTSVDRPATASSLSRLLYGSSESRRGNLVFRALLPPLPSGPALSSADTILCLIHAQTATDSKEYLAKPLLEGERRASSSSTVDIEGVRASVPSTPELHEMRPAPIVDFFGGPRPRTRSLGGPESPSALGVELGPTASHPRSSSARRDGLIARSSRALGKQPRREERQPLCADTRGRSESPTSRQSFTSSASSSSSPASASLDVSAAGESVGAGCGGAAGDSVAGASGAGCGGGGVLAGGAEGQLVVDLTPASSETSLESKATLESVLRRLGLAFGVDGAVRQAATWPEADAPTLHCPVRGVSDLDCSALSSLLCSPRGRLSALASINLSHNSIGDAGAAAIASALARGAPCLLRLALHENRIGCGGMAALAAAFAPGGADAISELRVGFNLIADEGIAALARAWERGGCRALRELHAAGNRIADAGMVALAEVLHKAPLLSMLALGSAAGGNCIGDAGAAALCRALRMNGGRALAINLKGNALSAAAADELRRAQTDCGPEVKVTLDYRLRLVVPIK